MSQCQLSRVSLLCVSMMIAGAGACGGPEGALDHASVPAATDPEPSRSTQVIQCPDPDTSCTTSNGRGIYFYEDGAAYVDAQLRILITRFTNLGSSVAFEGRYYDSAHASWLWLSPSGQVQNAIYRGTTYAVQAMEEGSTGLSVTLYDASSFTTRVIGGRELLNLTLRLRLFWTIGPATYLLSFTSVDTASDPGLVRYGLQWRRDVSGAVAVSYCLTPSGSADTAVFQQGLAVDPVNAHVTRDPSTTGYVTLSCRGGAIATCKAWGYPHNGSLAALNTLYDSCLQMKRASYCGDQNGWTVAGTQILINDSAGIKSNAIGANQLESYWTPAGATCVSAERQPGLGFSGSCNGVALPPCPSAPNGSPYLISGVP